MPPPVKRFKFSRSDQPTEINFDPEARQEYLTGFHKRKLARIQNAKDTAAKRDKEAKVLERKQLREQRKEDLQKHVEEVNLELKKQQNPEGLGEDSDAEEAEDNFEGFGDAEQKAAEDEEYVDEEKYTTVTVEAMGEPGSEDEEESKRIAEIKAKEAKEAKEKADAIAKKKRPWAKDSDKPKQKKRKFRYESKAERAATRGKQKKKGSAAKARRIGKE